jgi:hypothetical protein
VYLSAAFTPPLHLTTATVGSSASYGIPAIFAITRLSLVRSHFAVGQTGFAFGERFREAFAARMPASAAVRAGEIFENFKDFFVLFDFTYFGNDEYKHGEQHRKSRDYSEDNADFRPVYRRVY